MAGSAFPSQADEIAGRNVVGSFDHPPRALHVGQRRDAMDQDVRRAEGRPVVITARAKAGGHRQCLVLQVAHIGGLVQPGSRDTSLEQQHAVGGGERRVGARQVRFHAVRGRAHQLDGIGALVGGHQRVRDPHRRTADQRPVPSLFSDLNRTVGSQVCALLRSSPSSCQTAAWASP